MTHKFNIGQTVELAPRFFVHQPRGPYEIRHRVPASDRDPVLCYRIKSITEKHERVARESDLTLSVSVFA